MFKTALLSGAHTSCMTCAWWMAAKHCVVSNTRVTQLLLVYVFVSVFGASASLSGGEEGRGAVALGSVRRLSCFEFFFSCFCGHNGRFAGWRGGATGRHFTQAETPPQRSAIPHCAPHCEPALSIGKRGLAVWRTVWDDGSLCGGGSAFVKCVRRWTRRVGAEATAARAVATLRARGRGRGGRPHRDARVRAVSVRGRLGVRE